MKNPQDLTSVIKSRHSVRKWQAEKLEPQILQDIIDCGNSAPASHGADAFNNFIISDNGKIQELLAHRVQNKEVPFAINSRDWAEQSEGGIENYEPVSIPPHIIVVAGYKTKLNDPEGMVQTLSASAMCMLIAAEAYELGACWLYVHDKDDNEENYVKQILNLDENIKVLCFIALGKGLVS